ncbi:MAG TPA: biotin--[acetyl-CoA-carboxylase] ligase [Acidimicrobiales bacterium]|nr:biotin--[acetyl-CoA-carboxylase] ligase [Acidimicrobiales bacterium]
MVVVSFQIVLTPVELDRLAATRFADVRWVSDIGSTNATLLDEARDGAPEGRVLVADHQSAGRGRMGRTWQAQPGSSLLVSLLVRPDLPVDRLHLVTVAAGAAAADACGTVAGVAPSLKWPNDLLVGDRKLAGLLAESLVVGGRVEAVVVGMGLNVSWPDELPDELAGTAIALNHVVDAPVERSALLTAYLEGVEARYASLLAGGVDELLAEHRRRCATLGQRVRVELVGGASIEGVATDVTAEGHLIVETDDGTPREVTVGDVVHLRPTGG